MFFKEFKIICRFMYFHYMLYRLSRYFLKTMMSFYLSCYLFSIPVRGYFIFLFSWSRAKFDPWRAFKICWQLKWISQLSSKSLIIVSSPLVAPRICRTWPGMTVHFHSWSRILFLQHSLIFLALQLIIILLFRLEFSEENRGMELTGKRIRK